MIQPSPSGFAVVLRPAGLDPAPGSVSANDATTSPEAMSREPPCLLLVGAEPDQHLTGDSVVGAEHRAQCQRRVAEFHGDLGVLHQVQAQAAPFLRDRVAEQSHLGGLGAQVGRDGVGGHDLQFARNDLGHGRSAVICLRTSLKTSSGTSGLPEYMPLTSIPSMERWRASDKDARSPLVSLLQRPGSVVGWGSQWALLRPKPFRERRLHCLNNRMPPRLPTRRVHWPPVLWGVLLDVCEGR